MVLHSSMFLLRRKGKVTWWYVPGSMTHTQQAVGEVGEAPARRGLSGLPEERPYQSRQTTPSCATLSLSEPPLPPDDLSADVHGAGPSAGNPAADPREGAQRPWPSCPGARAAGKPRACPQRVKKKSPL